MDQVHQDFGVNTLIAKTIEDLPFIDIFYARKNSKYGYFMAALLEDKKFWLTRCEKDGIDINLLQKWKTVLEENGKSESMATDWYKLFQTMLMAKDNSGHYRSPMKMLLFTQDNDFLEKMFCESETEWIAWMEEEFPIDYTGVIEPGERRPLHVHLTRQIKLTLFIDEGGKPKLNRLQHTQFKSRGNFECHTYYFQTRKTCLRDVQVFLVR